MQNIEYSGRFVVEPVLLYLINSCRIDNKRKIEIRVQFQILEISNLKNFCLRKITPFYYNFLYSQRRIRLFYILWLKLYVFVNIFYYYVIVKYIMVNDFCAILVNCITCTDCWNSVNIFLSFFWLRKCRKNRGLFESVQQ